MIKTTAKSRALMAKHLNENYIDNFRLHGSDESRTCYMCDAARTIVVVSAGPACEVCPLGPDQINGLCQFRGPKTQEARMNWIIEQIHKFTDCEIIDDKEAG